MKGEAWWKSNGARALQAGMTWGIVGAITGVIGVSIALLTWLANRRAMRVLLPRIEGQSFSHGEVTHTLFKLAGPSAEHWSVSSVRVRGQDGKVAPWVRDGSDDGYGNMSYGPGNWDNHLDLSEHHPSLGIATAPTTIDVPLVFNIVAKSDRDQSRAVSYTVKATPPPADVHPA